MLPLLVDQLEEFVAGQPPEVIDEWLEKAAAFLLECRSVRELEPSFAAVYGDPPMDGIAPTPAA